jgi:hypothetical protein
MYRDSVDAFVQLTSARQGSSIATATTVITEISAKIGYLKNGIRHCSVQVAFASGDEYRIEALGEEAEALYREAKEQSVALNVVAH